MHEQYKSKSVVVHPINMGCLDYNFLRESGMLKFFLASALFAVTLPSVYAEDVTDAFIKCATTKQDRQRLACYDQIGQEMAKKYKTPSLSNKNNGYASMSLLDLKTDIKSLSGKKVNVVGSMHMVGDMVFLQSDMMDMSPVMVNIAHLPREDRKRIIKGCIALCDAQINGKVKEGPLGPELAAEQIIWK